MSLSLKYPVGLKYLEQLLGSLGNGTEIKKNRLYSWVAEESSKGMRDNSFKKCISLALGWEVISGLQEAWGLYLVLKEER